LKPFSETHPLQVSTVSPAGSPSRTGRLLFSVAVLYYLPPLLILSGVLPFAWRFQILAVMTIITFGYDYRRGISLKELGFRRDTLKDALLLNTAVSLLFVISILVPFKAGYLRASAPPEWELFFVYYLFISGPSQEFLFRCNLFALMRRGNLRGPFVQIMLSAVTFSFLHIIYNDPLILLVTFMAGLIWGWIYYRCPNFWGVALSHSIVGAIAIKVGLI